MQLKLELFEESLDKYRRSNGKLIQKLLQTGNPKGTFKQGDAHPIVDGVVYNVYRSATNSECWSTIEGLKKKKAKDKNWKNKNKDRIKNYNAKWNSENKQRKSELWEQWYDKNKEDVKKYQKKYGKKWRAENKENRKEWWNQYLKTEKGFINNKKAKIRYRRSVKGKITARHSSSKRRAIERKARVNLTEYEEGEIKQIYAHAVRVSNKLQIPFEVDHIVPLTKGGLHHPSNLQIAPASWNRSKRDRNTERWLPNGM